MWLYIGVPSVIGYKSVKLTGDVLMDGSINTGDTVTWKVTYVNVGTAPTSTFQINDLLPTGVMISTVGGQTVTVTGVGSSATKNNSYTGASAGAASDLLAPGAVLAPDGKIEIEIPTLIDSGAPMMMFNQSNATGTGLAGGGVNSDNIDSTTGGLLGGASVPADSVPQTQLPTIDPTKITISPPIAKIIIIKHAAPPSSNPFDFTTTN